MGITDFKIGLQIAMDWVTKNTLIINEVVLLGLGTAALFFNPDILPVYLVGIILLSTLVAVKDIILDEIKSSRDKVLCELKYVQDCKDAERDVLGV